MVSSSMSFLVNYVTASVGGSRALVDHFLEAVAIEVPLDRILDGVGALEEFGAFFLLVSTAVGIQVFVEEFPNNYIHLYFHSKMPNNLLLTTTRSTFFFSLLRSFFNTTQFFSEKKYLQQLFSKLI